jgi:hypothetical protein
MPISSKKIIIPFLICIFLCTKILAGELVCDVNIDCNRFDYTSKENFNKSVISYAVRWGLKNPTPILSKIGETHEVHICSIDDGLSLIEENPSFIYFIGKYVEKNKRPKEWLYIFEQSFLRKFNDLKR